jgi:hypothetical protein
MPENLCLDCADGHDVNGEPVVAKSCDRSALMPVLELNKDSQT